MADNINKIRWREALAQKLRRDYKLPVISNYRLAVELLTLVHQTAFEGQTLSLPARGVDQKMFYDARTALKTRAVVTNERSLPSTVMRVVERKGADPGETLCALDPFGYLAYLSAMAVHGLTNRLPRILYFVTPEPATWRKLADERMEKDLGELLPEFRKLSMPELTRPNIPKLGSIVIHTIKSKELGGWRHLRDESIRVATLGRTFLHMLQSPDLCGGINHVLEVFEEHAKLNLQAIVNEVDTHGGNIDKVRAGYILEERCGIADSRVEAWVQFAARGGSRKLDSTAEYQPNFSRKWCLSINV